MILSKSGGCFCNPVACFFFFFLFWFTHTQLDLINDVLWKVICVLIKFVGSAACKFVGQNWHDSLIGALMNTRGLMELIFKWFRTKVLTPEVFTMMVIWHW
jgi:hypothetical protein